MCPDETMVPPQAAATNASPYERRVAIERERLDFEKQQAAKASIIHTHLGAFISGGVALVAALFTAAQVWIAHIGKEKELQVAALQNDAEMDRRWRVEILGFLERHEKRLFSDDDSMAQGALRLLELSFPAQYVQPMRSKLNILLSPGPAASTGQATIDSLLRPLMRQFDVTKAAFHSYSGGDLTAEASLLRGNRTALSY